MPAASLAGIASWQQNKGEGKVGSFTIQSVQPKLTSVHGLVHFYDEAINTKTTANLVKSGSSVDGLPITDMKEPGTGLFTAGVTALAGGRC